MITYVQRHSIRNGKLTLEYRTPDLLNSLWPKPTPEHPSSLLSMMINCTQPRRLLVFDLQATLDSVTNLTLLCLIVVNQMTTIITMQVALGYRKACHAGVYSPHGDATGRFRVVRCSGRSICFSSEPMFSETSVHLKAKMGFVDSWTTFCKNN